MPEPIKLFITYSHRDRSSLETLEEKLAVLKQNGQIKPWSDNEILPGDRWREAIAESLKGADILLYVVSGIVGQPCVGEL